MAAFTGTSGNDTIAPGNVTAGVVRSPAGSTPLGTVADLLSGGEGNDSLEGGGGGDTLRGDGGNDTLSVGSTIALAEGGGGDDVFLAFGTLGANPISGGAGIDTIQQSGALSLTHASITGVERLALTGAAAVTLRASQLDGLATLTAAPGATAGTLVLSTPTAPSFIADVDVVGLTSLTVTGQAGRDGLLFRTAGPGTPTNITVHSGLGDDVVSTGAGNDSLDGGDNNDSLSSASGNDTFAGGGGNDTIEFDSGDVANGGAGDDLLTLRGSFGITGSIDGGAGIDTLRASQLAIIAPGASILGVETLALGAVPLTLPTAIFDGFNTILADGGVASAVLALTSDANTTVSAFTSVQQLGGLVVTAGAGNETLIFSTNTQNPTRLTVDGGAGDDSIRTGGAADSLDGGAGNDTLDGGAGVDILVGGAGGDLLAVRSGDSAFGLEDDDRFELIENITSGVMNGGTGIDTLDAQNQRTIGAGVSILDIELLALDNQTLTLTAAQLGSFQTIVKDSGAPFGSLQLSSGGIAILQVDAGLPRLVVGGSSDVDQLGFFSTASTVVEINAGAGGDSLQAGAGADIVRGDAGNDTIEGGLGADVLDGGADDDVLVLRAGDSAKGGSGNDTLQVAENLTGSESIDGGAGTDRLDLLGAITLGALVTFAGIEELALDAAGITLTTQQLAAFQGIVAAGADTSAGLTLTDGGAASFAVSGLAALSIAGSSGNDILAITGAAATAITAVLGAGNDSLQAGALADTLNGGAGRDTLSGADGHDSLAGTAGFDLLLGGAGADTLAGGTDADTLAGGLGADRLTGGAGADAFRFAAPAEGQDTLADFSSAQGDRIEISAAGFGGGLVAGAPLDPAQLRVATGSVANTPPGTGQLIFNTNTQVLSWDADGSGGTASVAIARLTGVATLAAGDFALIA